MARSGYSANEGVALAQIRSAATATLDMCIIVPPSSTARIRDFAHVPAIRAFTRVPRPRRHWGGDARLSGLMLSNALMDALWWTPVRRQEHAPLNDSCVRAFP